MGSMWTRPSAAGSAGRPNTRSGDRSLKAALGIAALSAARATGTYFAARYRRIAARRGPHKVAIEHTILIAA